MVRAANADNVQGNVYLGAGQQGQAGTLGNIIDALANYIFIHTTTAVRIPNTFDYTITENFGKQVVDRR